MFNFRELRNSILNKKQENQYLTGTVYTVNPLTVKLYPGDDAIPAVPTTNLKGLRVGSRVILLQIGNQLVAINVLGNDSLAKCLLEKTTTQSIPDATETSITFGSGTEQYDPLDMHDTSTNNDRIVIPSDGIYNINIGLGIPANTTGSRIIYINVNGSTMASLRMATDPTGHWRGNLNRTMTLSANDYVRFRIYQSTGGDFSVGGTGVYQTYFSVVKV